MKFSNQKDLYIINLETCTSTNDYLKKIHSKSESKFPILITSSEQTKGKGRQGRKWISLKNRGIYSSFGILLNPEKTLSLVPIICGISVIETLKKFSHRSFYIKWPNDILYKGKKIAGILIENTIHSKKIVSICGIGININHAVNDFPDQIKEQAISLKMITGKDYDLGRVTDTLVDYFLYWIHQLESGKDHLIVKKANQLCRVLTGKRIQLHQKNKKIEGIFIKINERGGMIVKNIDGEHNTFFFGEISTP